MPSLLRLPEVAADTPEATLVAWPIAENTPYAAGEALYSVETAKAIVDVEADTPGVILKRLVAEGTEVKVGEPVAVIGAPGETVTDLSALLDELGVSAGPEVSAGPVSPAPAAPPVAPAADPVAVLADGVGTEIAPVESAPPALDGASSNGGTGGRVFASPLARRLARDAGLDLSTLTGTGPHGRIRRIDIELARSGTAAPAAESAPAVRSATAEVTLSGQPAAVVPRVAGDWTDEPHTRLRRAIASRLTESKRTAPHFYLRGQARVDRLLALRAQINAAGGDKVSVNDLVVKAVAHAHGVVPAMNVIWTDDAVRRFDRVDIAVAVATPQGLVTPVVRDVANRSVRSVAAATRDCAERARTGSIKQHELDGGSITVSNLGMYGTSEFAAIINPPHAAILAVGAAVEEPVVVDHALAVGTVMRVTLSVDHRPVDGATAAEWMRAFLAAVENPISILA